MLNTKGFLRTSYIVHRSENQLDIMLMPAIIGLAISAGATYAFLEQCADLSNQAKILEAQYEIANLLQ